LLVPDASALVLYLLSPWALGMAYRSLGPVRVLGHAIYRARFGDMRSRTLPEAWEAIADRVLSDRAFRTRKYDAYLPPPPSATAATRRSASEDSSSPSPVAILFLPGAGVESVAYSRVASMLSDAGFPVAVVSAEPMRIASPDLGYDARYLKSVMDDFERRVRRRQHQQRANAPSSSALEPTFQWVGVGHSLGSFTLSHVAEQLGLSTLVFWGSAPFVRALADISQQHRPQQGAGQRPGIRVRVVQGTNDVVVRMVSTPEATAEYWRRLPGPREEIERVIEGGTHANFASYASAWSAREEAGISRREQHERAVALTVEFLNENGG